MFNLHYIILHVSSFLSYQSCPILHGHPSYILFHVLFFMFHPSCSALHVSSFMYCPFCNLLLRIFSFMYPPSCTYDRVSSFMFHPLFIISHGSIHHVTRIMYSIIFKGYSIMYHSSCKILHVSSYIYVSSIMYHPSCVVRFVSCLRREHVSSCHGSRVLSVKSVHLVHPVNCPR